MRIRRIFIILVLSGILGIQLPARAKISLGKIVGQDSVMMVIRDIEEVDTVPYEQAYEQEVEELRRQWRELANYEEIAKFYLFGSRSASTDIWASLAQMKAMNIVQTPQQREFVEMILEKVRSNSNTEKDAKDIEKQLAKGKLSAKAKPYINEFYRNVEKDKVDIQKTISGLENLRERKGVVVCMRSSFPNREIERRMISITDTLINLSWRPALYLNSSAYEIASYDKNEVAKGWEWAMSKDNREEYEKFPVPVSYYFSDSHPQYRIINKENEDNENWIIFDNNGGLVAVTNFIPDYELTRDEGLEKLILAHAYKNNELDIQSYSDHTKHYVKVQSGLEKLTAKEKAAQERASSALANAFLNSMKANMAYGKNSKKAKAVGRKSASQAARSLISNSNFYDELGYRWVDEVKGKYKSRIRNPYKTSRVDNTTFRSIYVDKEGNGIFELITTYQSGSPYKCKKTFTINSLAGKSYFTPEEVKEYNDLKAKYQ